MNKKFQKFSTIQFCILFLLLILLFRTNYFATEAENIFKLIEISPNPVNQDCEYVIIQNISNQTIDIVNNDLTLTDNKSTDLIKDSTPNIPDFIEVTGSIINPNEKAVILDSNCNTIDIPNSSTYLFWTAGPTLGNGLANSSDEVVIKLKMNNVEILQSRFVWTNNYGQGKIFKKIDVLGNDELANWSIDGIPMDKYSMSSTSTQSVNSLSSMDQGVRTGEVNITEVYPSPDTKLGEKEWFEIKNNTARDIDISSLAFKDESGGNFVPEKVLLKPGLYLQLFPKFSLNNAGDTIYIYYDNSLIDSLNYGEIDSGASWIRIDGTLKMTCKPTAFSANTLQPCNLDNAKVAKTTSNNSSSTSIKNILNSHISQNNSQISLDPNSLDKRGLDLSDESYVKTLTENDEVDDVLGQFDATHVKSKSINNSPLIILAVLVATSFAAIFLYTKQK
ncbi:lamin tail domain-containing protein [bacterium]|nr:MAG: lamin tail domain-containing protein [bacterium]